MTMTVHNLGNTEVSPAMIGSALARASMYTGSKQDSDESGHPVWPSTRMIEDYRGRLDGMALGQIREIRGAQWQPDNAIRLDAERYAEERADAAFTPGSPGFLRDFDYVHREILEEKRPPLNAGRMFALDTSVPLGAPTHSVRRAVVTGKAKWHNKGTAFPIAKAGYLEEQFRAGYVVCAVEQSFFEGLQLGFAGLQTYQLEARGALRAIEEFLNDVAVYGDVGRQIYGALSYPSLAKMVISTRFSTASTGSAIAAALAAAVNTPMVTSNGVFMPNRLAVAPQVKAFVATTAMDTAGGIATIEEFFLKGQDETTGIQRIESIGELSAAELTARSIGNPAGYHGIFAWNDDKGSVSHVLPQRPTFLPVWQSSPIDTMHVAFASTGGVVMPDVGNQILMFVQL